MIEHKGLFPRLGARIFDIMIIGIPSGFITGFGVGFTYVTETGDNFIFNLVMFLLTVIYMIVLPVRWQGYTAGKKVLGMRLVKTNRLPLNYKVMLKRELFIVAAYPLTFGILAVISAIMMVTREDKKALHDLFAGTMVINE